MRLAAALALGTGAYVYDFTSYTTLGLVPDCSSSILDDFKRLINVDVAYPNSRLFNQVKSVGLHKLLSLSAKGVSAGKRRRLENTEWGAPDAHALMRSYVLAKSLELTEDHRAKSELMRQRREVTPRRLDVNYDNTSFLRGILAKSMSLAAANQDSGLKGATSQPFTDYAVNDLRLARFLNGVFLNSLGNQIVKGAQISFGSNTTVQMESAMVNLGEAICNSSAVATQFDPQYAALDVCTIATLLRQLLSCYNVDKEPVQCDGVAELFAAGKDSCDAYDQFPSVSAGGPSAVASSVDANQLVIDIDIEEVRLQDVNASSPSHIKREQGNMDRWLYQATRTMYQYAKRGQRCGIEFEDVEFVPGWVTVAMTRMDQTTNADEETNMVPAAVLLKHPSSCKYAVVARGTQTLMDWMIDFQSAQVDLHVRGKSLGKAHAGFANIAAPTAAFFANIIQDQECDGVANITVTGHSMGAGVSMVAALLLSEWLPKSEVSVVGIATPHALNPAASELLQQRAKVRAWINTFDAVPRLPCSGGAMQFRCPTATGEQAAGVRDEYADTPNELLIGTDEIGELIPELQRSSFGEVVIQLASGTPVLDNMQVPGPLQLSLAHSDAYECWFNANYCKKAGVCA